MFATAALKSFKGQTLVRADLKSILLAQTNCELEFSSHVSMMRTVIDIWNKQQDLQHGESLASIQSIWQQVDCVGSASEYIAEYGGDDLPAIDIPVWRVWYCILVCTVCPVIMFVSGMNFQTTNQAVAIPLLRVGNGFGGYMAYWAMCAVFALVLLVSFVKKGWFTLVGLSMRTTWVLISVGFSFILVICTGEMLLWHFLRDMHWWNPSQ